MQFRYDCIECRASIKDTGLVPVWSKPMIVMMALPTEDNRGETRSMTRFQTDLRLHCSGGQDGRSHRVNENSPDTLVSPWEDKLSVLPLGWLFSTPMMAGR